MRNSTTVGLTALALLMSGMALGQDAATADPRLSDPAFIKVRDEAVAAAKCADRTKPELVSRPRPQELEALIRRVHGAAIAEGIILFDGSVKYTRVVRADNPELGNAAVEVLKGSSYIAATCSGKLVPAIVTLTQNFSIH
jgi:hypothetical protein